MTTFPIKYLASSPVSSQPALLHKCLLWPCRLCALLCWNHSDFQHLPSLPTLQLYIKCYITGSPALTNHLSVILPPYLASQYGLFSMSSYYLTSVLGNFIFLLFLVVVAFHEKSGFVFYSLLCPGTWLEVSMIRDSIYCMKNRHIHRHTDTHIHGNKLGYQQHDSQHGPNKAIKSKV